MKFDLDFKDENDVTRLNEAISSFVYEFGTQKQDLDLQKSQQLTVEMT